MIHLFLRRNSRAPRVACGDTQAVVFVAVGDATLRGMAAWISAGALASAHRQARCAETPKPAARGSVFSKRAVSAAEIFTSSSQIRPPPLKYSVNSAAVENTLKYAATFDLPVIFVVNEFHSEQTSIRVSMLYTQNAAGGGQEFGCRARRLL